MYNEVKHKHILSKILPDVFKIDLNTVSSQEAKLWIDFEQEYREELNKQAQKEAAKNKYKNGYDNVGYAVNKLKGRR